MQFVKHNCHKAYICLTSILAYNYIQFPRRCSYFGVDTNVQHVRIHIMQTYPLAKKKYFMRK